MPNVRSVINESRGSSGGMLMYPKDIAKYGMVFTFSPYEYTQTFGVIGTPNTYAGAVVLPLPSNGLKESTGISLSDTDLGLGGALVAGIASEATSSGSIMDRARGAFESAGFQSIGNALNTSNFAGAANAAARSLGRGLADLVPSIGAGLDVGLGNTMNNFTTLAFNNVSLRSHSFEWRFYPEEQSDSDTIASIRAKFQQAAHPTYSLGGDGAIGKMLLNYPMLVRPYILIDSSETYYYQFKPCLIQSVNFAYSSDGGMAFVKGGKPASVKMSLQIKETSIWTGEDYGGSGPTVEPTIEPQGVI